MIYNIKKQLKEKTSQSPAHVPYTIFKTVYTQEAIFFMLFKPDAVIN